jgi:4-hydroxybenzoyl-CoA reductase subunit beta
MSLSAFRVVRPESVLEAARVLADYGPEAMIVAGGTDVIPNLQMKLFAPRLLVDIKRLVSLAGIAFDSRDGLCIGALTTLAQLCDSSLVRERFPVLWHAACSVAGPLQRNMGTLGGNLCLETRCVWYNQSEFWRQSLGGCLKKDGSVCHVAPAGESCWAVWSGDTAPALLALDAELEIAGPSGSRRVSLESFYTDDGMDRIALGRGELVVAARVPAAAVGRRGVYYKLRVRDSIDYPLAGVAAAMEVDREGVCRRARIALGAVNPAPRLVREAAERIEGRVFSSELVEEVARAAIRTGKPLATSASTPVYRRDMVRLFTRRALEQLWQARAINESCGTK